MRLYKSSADDSHFHSMQMPACRKLVLSLLGVRCGMAVLAGCDLVHDGQVSGLAW